MRKRETAVKTLMKKTPAKLHLKPLAMMGQYLKMLKRQNFHERR